MCYFLIIFGIIPSLTSLSSASTCLLSWILSSVPILHRRDHHVFHPPLLHQCAASHLYSSCSSWFGWFCMVSVPSSIIIINHSMGCWRFRWRHSPLSEICWAVHAASSFVFTIFSLSTVTQPFILYTTVYPFRLFRFHHHPPARSLLSVIWLVASPMIIGWVNEIVAEYLYLYWVYRR